MANKTENKAYIIFTLIFAGLCAVIIGIFALVLLVLAPNADNALLFILAILLSIVAIFIFIVLIAMIRTSLQDSPNKIFPCSQIVIILITVAVSIFWAILPFKIIGTKFESGDFSETEECILDICFEPANGGRAIFRTGISKKDVEIQYFCTEHFIQIQKEINNDDSYKPSQSTPAFTNKYGNALTYCAIPGCKEYIARSGDTNCCTKHSNRCLECRCYIDSDAMYCMDCIEDALD